MQQKEINQREWEKPDNWHGWRGAQFYAADRDSRIVVPKRRAKHGGTFNLAHPVGRFLLTFALALAVAGIAVAVATASAR